MEIEGAVQVVPQEFGMVTVRDPKSVLAEAKRAAQALTDVIKAMPADKKVMMGGEQYIEFDHWQLVGRFYGCSTQVVSTEQVEIGGAIGFKTRANVLDRDGRVISSAEAMCLNDEEKWSTRPKYEWKNKVREKVGEVKVPMNQLLSMSQTRACAKSLRQVFSWVVVLAGYAPTPAEELTGHEQPPADPNKPPIQQPKLKESPEQGEKAQGTVADVSERQVKTKDGDKIVYTVTSSSGQKFETWEVALADKAVPLKGTETLVHFVFKNVPWTNKKGESVNSYKLLGIEEAPQVGA